MAFLINFAFIFFSMVLFFVPFTAVFFWRYRTAIRHSRPHFNYFMEKFFASRESNALVFAWAASEAIWWFVIPEFLLILMVFIKVQRKIDLVKYDIYGTIAGTLVAMILHFNDQMLHRVPYIYDGMIMQVRGWYDMHGIWGLVYQPFSGVPYKVFTHISAEYSFFIPLFLLMAVAVRMIRYIIVYEIAKAVYPVLHPLVRRHYGILFIIAIAIFTAMLMRVSAIYS